MNDYTVKALSLQVGENECERRFVWYQPARFESAQVQYALLSEYERDGGFTADNSLIAIGKVSDIYKTYSIFHARCAFPLFCPGRRTFTGLGAALITTARFTPSRH